MKVDIKNKRYEIPLERINIMFGKILYTNGKIDKNIYNSYMNIIKQNRKK